VVHSGRQGVKQGSNREQGEFLFQTSMKKNNQRTKGITKKGSLTDILAMRQNIYQKVTANAKLTQVISAIQEIEEPIRTFRMSNRPQTLIQTKFTPETINSLINTNISSETRPDQYRNTIRIRPRNPLPSKMTVEISNLNVNASNDDIKYVLRQFGDITNMVVKGIGNKFNGQVMVIFKERESGVKAIKALNGTIADGKTLRVREVVDAIQIAGVARQ
jgi:hypothetical protein